MQFQTKSGKLLGVYVIVAWAMFLLMLVVSMKRVDSADVIRTASLSFIFPALYLIALWPPSFDYARKATKVRIALCAMLSLLLCISFLNLEVHPPSSLPIVFSMYFATMLIGLLILPFLFSQIEKKANL